MIKVYGEADADLGVRNGRTVAILGFGNQGHAQGLNLRDSGVEVIVGGITDASWERAKADGFPAFSSVEGAKRADVVLLLLPDEVQAGVYREDVAQHLETGNTLVFAHGYNICFGLIVPSEDVDVVMVAPRMIGKVLRDHYVDGSGTAAYVGVHQDASGEATATTLAVAKGIGATRVIEQSFTEETELDLLMEQGGDAAMFQVMIVVYEFLVEAGFAPEVAALELYASKELAETASAMADVGFFKQMTLHSQTSQYGHLSRGPGMIAATPLKEKLAQTLQAIRNGDFAREWAEEERQGYPEFTRLREQALQHPINDVEDNLRRLLNVN